MNAEEFRRSHATGRPLLLPNAWDFASAAAFADAGFPAVGTTSLGVAAAHGLPDGRGAARVETLALARLLGRLPCALTVDIEAGFADDPAEVGDLAAEIAAAGAVGVNLEDGRPDGTLAPVAEHQAKIAAVKERVPAMFVNARTDTHWLAPGPPPSAAEALTRVRAYVDAGADGVFVPGLLNDAQIAAVVSGVDAPVNVLFQAGRHTVPRLTALGVRRISFGSLLFRTALQAAVDTALSVAAGGPGPDAVPGYREVEALIERARRASAPERPTPGRASAPEQPTP